jgi:hypothetical protein
MSFKEMLSEKKPLILDKWLDAILNNYPADSARFFKKQKDGFRNPVGYTISTSIKGLFDEIIEDPESEKLYPYLDEIIKIKAVQNFSPSKAVFFIYQLKKIVRNELENEIKQKNLLNDLKIFEDQMDKLALLAFDIYMLCRERIFEIRVKELKNMSFRLLKRANLVRELEEQESNFNSETVLTQNIKG